MKFKRKLNKKEKGVSEVLGSILVLLITVMLFSTVFYYVNSMPTPKQRIYAQFDASMHIVKNSNGAYCLNITVKNVGGESLIDWRTMFIIVIDFTAKQHMLSWANFSSQPFAKDGKFSQGESFYYNSSWDHWNNVNWSSIEDIRSHVISITLLDKSTGNIIWSTKLQGRANMPPVLVGLTTSPSPPILGKPATFKAIIFNPNNNNDVSEYNVTLDFSDSILKYSIYGSPIKYMSYSGGNSFTAVVNFKNNNSLNILTPYTVKVKIVYGSSSKGPLEVTYPAHIFLSRGTGSKAPDLYINSKFITLSTLDPTHGDNVQVSVTIENLGGTGAKFKLMVMDKYKGYPTGEIYIKTNLGSSEYLPSPTLNYTVAAAGQTTISFIWENVGANENGVDPVSRVSGTHQLIFKIINITPAENPNKYKDNASVSLTVLPNILLVDDDGYAQGSPLDTSRYYKYYLDTAGYKYDLDEGSINIGQLKTDIDSHDLVIWETGYKKDPITSEQAMILRDYVYNKGGALWLISQGISQNKLSYILNGNYNSIKISRAPVYKIEGVKDTSINLTTSNEIINDTLINRDNAQSSENTINGNETTYFEDNNLGNLKSFILGNISGQHSFKPIGVYEDYSISGEGKLVYLGFELSRVQHYYKQDFIAYRILKYLANISGRVGNDLAVEDMSITPRNPLYKEPVHISVVVSNNGGKPLSSEVLLEVDGIVSLNINTTNPNSTGVIPPDGGFVTVNFTWIPTHTGEHDLTAIVNPYHTIKETNYQNNIINKNIIDTNVFVHFSTLVVYNGSSSASLDEKNNVVDTLQDLGYLYKTLNTNSNPLPSGYSTGDYFAQYNLIIWANTHIGNKDVNAIKESLIKNPDTSQLFVGSDLTEEIVSNTQLTNYLGINLNGGNTVANECVLYGINNVNSVSNGMSIVIKPGTVLYNISSENSEGLFRKYVPITAGYLNLENVASQRQNPINTAGYGLISKAPQSGSKYGIIPFDLSDVIGIFGLKNASIAKPYAPALQARAWIIYRLFNWFGYQPPKPELATYTSDINITYGSGIPNIPPIIGRSYMISTIVYNYGSVGANTIVRFYDDLNWIGSKTVYVPGGKYAQVEIKWVPMFAGAARHIRVVVDPLNEVKETTFNGTVYNGRKIFNFDNEAVKTVRVYYFWDNMENGAGNWMHEATVLDINGESPLGFIDRKDVNTSVIGNWDWSISGSNKDSGNFHKDLNIFYSNATDVLKFTNGAYHSAPAAFWIPEAPRAPIRKPVDVIFVIDTSGSMLTKVPGANVGDVNNDGYSNTRIDVAIASAEDAISELSDIDRVAIFAFNQNGNGHPEKILNFTYATQANIQNVIDPALKSLRAKGGTPLYDTVSYATYYMDEHGRNNAIKGILVLTDGLSNDDTYGPSQGRQYIYAPGTGPDEAESGIVNKYVKGQVSGLLDMPYSVMVISIAPNAWDGRLFALGNSSKGNVSMALFESNPYAIEGAFATFISLLTQTASTGGLKAVDPTISNLGAVVFADGFRAYANEWGSGTPDDANTPGFYGKWTQSGFTMASIGNGDNYYYKGQSDDWSNLYWVAQTSTAGAYMEHTVYPYDVLHYHYPGSYTIKGATLNFWVGVDGKDWWWPDATIKVYADGSLIATLKGVLDGSSNTVVTGSNYTILYPDKYEAYCNVTVPSKIASLPSYNIEIKINNTYDYIGIDDVMVVYYIDYTPPSSGSTNGGVPWDYLNIVNTQMNYTFLITNTVDINDAKGAMLSFWTKYWMTSGTNGGVVYLWLYNNTAHKWVWDKEHRIYLIPRQSYTGNLMMGKNKNGNPIGVDKDATTGGPNITGEANGLVDKYGNLPYWCFNGRSGGGTFEWNYIEIPLTKYINDIKDSGGKFRIVFLFAQYGGLTPSTGWNPAMGWYLDDVKITVTSDTFNDLWQLYNFGGTGSDKAHSGDYAWAYGFPNNHWALPKGVDSSLITKQIDLGTARTAYLSFWIRFNLNPAAGVPPATVRVEISDNNGMTWRSITYGVRIGWGASGTGGISGESTNGKYGWVNSGTLSRINCDLSGWAGKSIEIRFRVVTNNTSYPTYANRNDPYGVFIDDVMVYGEGYAPTITVQKSDYIWTSSATSAITHTNYQKESNTTIKNHKQHNLTIPLHIQKKTNNISINSPPHTSLEISHTTISAIFRAKVQLFPKHTSLWI